MLALGDGTVYKTGLVCRMEDVNLEHGGRFSYMALYELNLNTATGIEGFSFANHRRYLVLETDQRAFIQCGAINIEK